MLLLRKKTTEGMDWHDTSTREDYVLRDGNMNFEGYENSIKDAIVKDVSDALSNALSTAVSEEVLRKYLFGKNPEPCIIYDENKMITTTISRWEYSMDYNGWEIRTKYCLNRLVENDCRHPMYYIVENIYAPCKGVERISRVYKQGFLRYEDAQEALVTYKPHLPELLEKNGDVGQCDVQIQVFENTCTDAWLAMNKKAMDLAEGLVPEKCFQHIDVWEDIVQMAAAFVEKEEKEILYLKREQEELVSSVLTHLQLNGYTFIWDSIRYALWVDEEEVSYVKTVLKERNIDYY